MRATLLSLFAASLVFVALRPPSLGYAPGLYQSRRGSVVYFDKAAFDSKTPIIWGCPLIASGRAGEIERQGAFRIEETVPGGARVTLLSRGQVGKRGWIPADELTRGRNGKVWEIGTNGEKLQ